MNPIIQMLQKTSPSNADNLFNTMMQNNPQFRQFVNSTRGKSVEQIAKENGVNIDVLQALMKNK